MVKALPLQGILASKRHLGRSNYITRALQFVVKPVRSETHQLEKTLPNYKNGQGKESKDFLNSLLVCINIDSLIQIHIVDVDLRIHERMPTYVVL